MNKNFIRAILGIFIFTFVFSAVSFLGLSTASAQGTTVDFGEQYPEGIGLSDQDPRGMAAGVITVILAFLGILAVVIILFGGFKWMTAAGNEDQVGEAKKIIIAGIIGLIIVLASWGIANFLLDTVAQAI